MTVKQIFKKILLPCAAGLTIDSHSHGPNCVKRTQESRPSSLPIYSNDCYICGHTQKKEETPSQMEEAVGNIRKELWVWQDNIRGYRHRFVDVYKDSFHQVECPGGVVPEKCVARDHLEHSFDDSCYPLVECPDSEFRRTKNMRCCKPPWSAASKPKKPCIERCVQKPPPQTEPNCGCSCCQKKTSGCGTRY